MAGRNRLNFNSLLVEGMVAIRGLLEGRQGEVNTKAALGVAEVMHNLQPNPTMLGKVASDLEGFRHEYPDVAKTWLPQTFAWLDSDKSTK